MSDLVPSPQGLLSQFTICTDVRHKNKNTAKDAETVIIALTVSSVSNDAMLQQAISSIKAEIPDFSQRE